MAALVNDLIRSLHKSSLVRSVRIVGYDETPNGKLEIKIRCRLVGKYKLQLWLHEEENFRSYAYQLFTDHPILRWDNSPHYPNISSAPHHFHNEAGEVGASPLAGKPLQDLKSVLRDIEKWLSKRGAI